MVTENVATLLEVLEEEQACCNRLIEVSEDEQKSLVDNNLDILNTRIHDMQKAVKDLHMLQQRRRELLEQLAKNLDVGPENLSLPSVLEKLEGSVAGELKVKLKRLAKTGESLYQVNQHTIYLINFSLNLIEQQISVWTDVLTEKDGYGENGQSKTTPSDAKIIEEKV